MPITDALEALERASDPKPGNFTINKYPDALRVVERWVEMRKTTEAKVSYREVVDIIRENLGIQLSVHHLRRWVEHYHPDIVEPRGAR